MKLKNNYLYLLVVNIILLIIAFSFLSDFTYNLFHEKGRYSRLYHNMWERMVDGNFEVDYKFIGGEAFIINGKIIAYFLPFPALVRGFFSIFDIGIYPIPSFLIAILIYSFSTYFLFWNILNFYNTKNINFILKSWFPILLIPIVSLFVESSVFWEVILWGQAIFTLLLLFTLKYLDRKNLSSLVVVLLIASCALFTRPTYAVGASVLVFTLFIYTIFSKNYKQAPIYLIYIIGLAFLGYLNYKRWGNVFDFAPLQFHEQMLGNKRGELAAISPSISLYRIPDALTYYFGIFGGNLNLSPPFVHGVTKEFFFKLGYFDNREMNYSIPLLLPVNFLLSVYGFFLLLKNYKIFSKENLYKLLFLIFVCSVLAFIMLTLISLALRYRGEFFPLLSITSMIGILFLSNKYSDKTIRISFIFTTVAFLFVVLGLIPERFTLYSFFRCHNSSYLTCALLGI